MMGFRMQLLNALHAQHSCSIKCMQQHRGSFGSFGLGRRQAGYTALTELTVCLSEATAACMVAAFQVQRCMRCLRHACLSLLPELQRPKKRTWCSMIARQMQMQEDRLVQQTHGSCFVHTYIGTIDLVRSHAVDNKSCRTNRKCRAPHTRHAWLGRLGRGRDLSLRGLWVQEGSLAGSCRHCVHRYKTRQNSIDLQWLQDPPTFKKDLARSSHQLPL